MRGTSPTLRHAGDWLGWLGAGMLSSSLLLMIREPLLVRWFGGLERMYRWHHVFGVWACVVLLAHPVILAASVLPTNAARAWRLLSPERGFPSNALGWVALIGLVAGLCASLLWRVRYAVWRRLHFSLSLAVLLGIAHVFAYRGLSAGFLLAAVPSVLALGWRVVRADQGFGAHPYEVESLSRIASRTTEVTIRPLAAPLEVAPGEFVMVAFFEGPHYQGCGEFHPYTVCGTRADGSLVLAIKALGDCTTRIQGLERGVAARVQGPYGEFLRGTPRSPSLWIAGGIGVTPFVAKLRAGDLTTPTELIYTYRRPDAAAYLAELQEHAEHQQLFGLRTLVAQDDPHPVFTLFDDVQDLPSREVYLSGPPPFIRAVVEELHRRGVPRANIHAEEFELRSSRN
jgi:predicted ferric reductase